MQYDLKDIGQAALVKLMWHGAPTRVLVHGEGVKRDVGTGEVLEVTAKQARELLSMNRLFTLDGDKPVKQASPLVIPEKTDEEGNKVVSSFQATLTIRKRAVSLYQVASSDVSPAEAAADSAACFLQSSRTFTV